MNTTKTPVTLGQIHEATRPWYCSVGYPMPAVRDGTGWPPGHVQPTWDEIIAGGRDYLCGADYPLTDFIRTHRSPLRHWQQLAYQWAVENPGRSLVLENSRKAWRIRLRADYVQFTLPYHDKGGEYDWVSRDCKTRILINVD